MKLNLLPQTVRVGAKSKTAWIFSILMVLFGIGACAMMIITADKADADSAAALEAIRPQADKAYTESIAADTIIATSSGVILNTNLATAMIAHDKAYPDMYEDLFRQNPPFFRLTSISATPIDEKTASITMTGTLTTYQQYADLMLALMHNKKVVSVSRAGYNFEELQVPPLVPTDQIGKPRKPGTAPIPDDPLLRLTYFESTPNPTGYLGVGNYGSDQPIEREAMPGDSLITVQIVAAYSLQTPSPLATLASGGGAGGPAAGGAPVSAPVGPGNGPPPGVTPGVTPAAPPTGAPPSGNGKNDAD